MWLCELYLFHLIRLNHTEEIIDLYWQTVELNELDPGVW